MWCFGERFYWFSDVHKMMRLAVMKNSWIKFFVWAQKETELRVFHLSIRISARWLEQTGRNPFRGDSYGSVHLIEYLVCGEFMCVSLPLFVSMLSRKLKWIDVVSINFVTICFELSSRKIVVCDSLSAILNLLTVIYFTDGLVHMRCCVYICLFTHFIILPQFSIAVSYTSLSHR